MTLTLRTPFPHQIKAMKFMSVRDRGCLALDPGLGKTLTVLRGLDCSTGKNLVICPASLRENWERECKLEKVKAEIISYERLVKEVSEIVEGIKKPEVKKTKLKKEFGRYKNLIVDESHYIKNIASKRCRAVMAISNYIKNVWFLTGSPVTRSSADLFSTLSVCQPGVWGNYNDFCRKYCKLEYNPWSRGKVYTGFRNSLELRGRLKESILRMKKQDVLDSLPDLFETKYWVDAGSDVYRESMESIWKNRMSDHISAARQEAAHKKMKTYLASLTDRAIEHGLIFVWHREVGKVLAKNLGAELVTGETSIAKRYEAIEKYQSNKCDWLVISIAAGGVGLNIQRAGYVGFFELPFTRAEVDQALSRAHRMGNENKKLWVEYVMLENSIDIPIYQIVMERKRETEKLEK